MAVAVLTSMAGGQAGLYMYGGSMQQEEMNARLLQCMGDESGAPLAPSTLSAAGVIPHSHQRRRGQHWTAATMDRGSSLAILKFRCIGQAPRLHATTLVEPILHRFLSAYPTAFRDAVPGSPSGQNTPSLADKGLTECLEMFVGWRDGRRIPSGGERQFWQKITKRRDARRSAFARGC